MRILGIETSCDETGVSIIEASGYFGRDFEYRVLGHALVTQMVHAQYGGVFPNLAKREHAKNIVPLAKEALRQAGELVEKMGPDPISAEKIREILVREHELGDDLVDFLRAYAKPNIDAIAVTAGPGLEPALWVGVNFARALSVAWNIPLVAVNHLEGHVMLSMVDDSHFKDFDFPLLSLIISGGHTQLVLLREWMRYEIVGETRDDAVGEAYDKVARLLGLPYPGGASLSKLGAQARAENVGSLVLPRPMLRQDNVDFSFAGLKTETRKHVGNPSILTDEKRKEIARAFTDAAAEVLVKKTIKALQEYGANAVLLGGGVSADTFIRDELRKALDAESAGIPLLVPPAALSGDNALMIAIAGYFHALKKECVNPDTLVADGNWRLGQ